MPQYRFPQLIKILNFLLAVVALLAIVSFFAEFGFYLSDNKIRILKLLNFVIIFYFILYSIIKLVLVYDRFQYLKSHWFNYLLVFLLLGETLIFIFSLDPQVFKHLLTGKGLLNISKLYIVIFQITIFLSILSYGYKVNQKIASHRFYPARVLLMSFAVIILIGTIFLIFPKAVNPGQKLSVMDAIFTSTSATCVTGLTIADTGTVFSSFGQIIILILIQIGGLGLMTYASFFALILGQNISLREKILMRDVLNTQSMDVISRLLVSTVVFTFIIEGIGAVLIFIGLGANELTIGERIYSGIFHSISAFCNAGFSIYPDSLISLRQNYLVVSTMACLIILGGLGFPVILNLLSIGFFSKQTSARALSVQTRLVVGISGMLILIGTVFFLAVENHQTLLNLSWTEKVFNAFFQSVTTRTAGFNTVDIAKIAPATALLFMFLMFVGASPGSTGGGIKTTTMAILLTGVWSIVKGRNRVELFKKDIPFMVLNRAIIIFIFSIFFVFICTLLLTLFENFPFLDLLFETISAFGTVGLSRGVTPFLSGGSKFVIILLMFFGRLGALTISLAITSPKETYHYTYPSENVMVG